MDKFVVGAIISRGHERKRSYEIIKRFGNNRVELREIGEHRQDLFGRTFTITGLIGNGYVVCGKRCVFDE